jgi:DNA-binding transcriptional LysR family regulator
MWPDRYDLRRIPIRNPVLIYPMSLIWRDDNRHPALRKFRDHLGSRRAGVPGTGIWTPGWRSRAASSP